MRIIMKLELEKEYLAIRPSVNGGILSPNYKI
jgi:hypothetical protein